MAGPRLREILRGGHSSGTALTRRLEQPTRMTGPKTGLGFLPAFARTGPRHPYSALLPVGFAMPSPLPETRCALTAPFHPYCPSLYPSPQAGRERQGSGIFSVALSLKSPSPDVIRHRVSVEPGLSSAPKDSGRPAD